mmetsp:Transcript_6926/g.28391  ORF Transcript_6926/g.28391 Transcript_6926/m.28391 type:complete len:501 (+) Transcript_6926:104-1606(+)
MTLLLTRSLVGRNVRILEVPLRADVPLPEPRPVVHRGPPVADAILDVLRRVHEHLLARAHVERAHVLASPFREVRRDRFLSFAQRLLPSSHLSLVHRRLDDRVPPLLLHELPEPGVVSVIRPDVVHEFVPIKLVLFAPVQVHQVEVAVLLQAELVEDAVQVQAVDFFRGGQRLSQSEEHLRAFGVVHDHHRALARLDEDLAHLVGDEQVELVGEAQQQHLRVLVLALRLRARALQILALALGRAPELATRAAGVHLVLPLLLPRLEVLLLRREVLQNRDGPEVRPPVHHHHLARHRRGLLHVQHAVLRHLVRAVQVPLRHLARHQNRHLALVPRAALDGRRAVGANLIRHVHDLPRLFAVGKHAHLGDVVVVGAHHAHQRLRGVVRAHGVAHVRVHLLNKRVLRHVVRFTHRAAPRCFEHVGPANLVNHGEKRRVPGGHARFLRRVAQRAGAHEVFQVCAREPRGLPRDELHVQVRVDHALELLVRAVQVDDVHARAAVG